MPILMQLKMAGKIYKTMLIGLTLNSYTNFSGAFAPAQQSYRILIVHLLSPTFIGDILLIFSIIIIKQYSQQLYL